MSARSLPLTPRDSYRQILGLRFFTGDADRAVRLAAKGGLVVAPAAPGLCEMRQNASYREALQRADLVITDSGFLVLLWNAMKRDKIKRLSGLNYLRRLLTRSEFRKPGMAFWIMPSRQARQKNVGWLQRQGFVTATEDCYVAPKYTPGRIQDPELLAVLNRRKPKHIIVCLGGGTQERLGLFLKEHCSFRPAIHCIGAAIGFLSGDQVPIPDWADRMILGWLFRCLSNPTRFVPRYVRALELPLILLRDRTQDSRGHP